MLGGPTSSAPPMGCYRTTDSSGANIASADVPHQIGQDLATKMYSTMAALQIVDTVFYEAQRQVSIRSPAGKTVVPAKIHLLQPGLVNAGKVLILHDKRRGGSNGCGLCCSIEPGRHCKQLTCLLNDLCANWRAVVLLRQTQWLLTGAAISTKHAHANFVQESPSANV